MLSCPAEFFYLGTRLEGLELTLSLSAHAGSALASGCAGMASLAGLWLVSPVSVLLFSVSVYRISSLYMARMAVQDSLILWEEWEQEENRAIPPVGFTG